MSRDWRSILNTVFCSKNARNPFLKINGRSIWACASSKYLGIHPDVKWQFHNLVFSVVKQLSKHISIIALLRDYVPEKVLLKYYSSLIKPSRYFNIHILRTKSFPALPHFNYVECSMYLIYMNSISLNLH